jgi:tetratricopeptide (TPR) repeat protein
VAKLSKDQAHLYPLFLFRKGKWEAALAEFQRLAGENPNDRKARTRLLTALLIAKQVPLAEMILADTLKRNPKDTEALLQRSELRLRSGDLRAAEADLNQVIGLNPDSAAAHFQLARVKLSQGLPRIERQELTVALQRDPKYLPARVALSRNLRAANEARAARELMEQTPPAQRKLPIVWTERNWALLGLGERKAAREAIDRALRVTRAPELILQDGLLRMDEGDLAGARKDAEELLGRSPEDERAWRLLLDSDAARGQLPKALDTLRAMAAWHPGSAPIQFVLGRVLSGLGDWAAGRKAFEAAIAADPKFSTARLALAAMDLSENRLDPARQGAGSVIAADPGNAAALLVAAVTESQSGNTAAAIARYRSMLDIDGSNVLAMNDLARLTARDNPEQALKLAQQAVELAPDNAATQDTLGWVYYSKGFYTAAIQHLKAAVAREPAPRYQYHLALSYLKAGDEDLGQPLLALALKRDPELSMTHAGW